jgi:hypothetical protein
MAATERYRQQHIELDALFAQVIDRLHNTAGETWAHDLSRLLAEFTGRLSTHLAVEDSNLYPSLAASGHGGLTAMAQRYKTEMGDLYHAYMDFWKRWRTASHIQKDAAAFLADARPLFGRLRARIEREDRELYALADMVLA